MKQTALVTGGNKGIGLEVTRMLIESGHKVTIIARDFSPFELSDHPQVTAVPYDLTNVSGIGALVEKIGSVDILVNNAGVMYSLPYDAYPDDKIERILNLNIQAPVALIREVSKSMISKGCGRIVNNASIAAHIGHPDVWYGITKAGLLNATKSFAKLLGPHGIVVNAVAPGPVETEMLAVIPEERKKAIRQTVFTGRFAMASEVAKAIFWLAVDCPAYINGTCIDINNGAFLR